MDKNKLIILILIGGTMIWAGFSFISRPVVEGEYDLFAKCLAGKGVIMYGSEWCAYCNVEKMAFGKSFQYVPYIECPQNIDLCLEKKISGYPTWIFSDGSRLEGVQGIQNLAEKSGCNLSD